MRIAIGLVFLIGLVACGNVAPAPTPTINIAPTQTRVVELTEVAQLRAIPTNTKIALFPTSQATVQPTRPVVTAYALKQVVSVKNWDLTVDRAQQFGKEMVWSQYGNKSVAAGTWYVVVVQMRNTGNTNFGVNGGIDFALQAAGGITYKPSTDAGAYMYSQYQGGQQIGGQVPPGVTVTYFVAFDIAPDAKDLSFVFQQDSRPRFVLPQQ